MHTCVRKYDDREYVRVSRRALKAVKKKTETKRSIMSMHVVRIERDIAFMFAGERFASSRKDGPIGLGAPFFDVHRHFREGS